MAGTVSGKPAKSVAIRATLRLSSPAWLAHPKNTSSTVFHGKFGCLSFKYLMGNAAKSSARTALKAPAYRPIGVRIKSQIKTSSMLTPDYANSVISREY